MKKYNHILIKVNKMKLKKILYNSKLKIKILLFNNNNNNLKILIIKINKTMSIHFNQYQLINQIKSQKNNFSDFQNNNNYLFILFIYLK